MAKHVVVTGGNTGIGFALCKQLVAEHGCVVYLGSRNASKGQAAVASILRVADAPGASCHCVELDTSSDSSVAGAAERVRGLLGGQQLYAVVNNAGTGLGHGVTPDVVVNTNLYGPKRMCDAFLPLLSPSEGRIVNVGSGAGPMYVAKCPAEMQRRLCKEYQTWEEIEANLREGLGSNADTMGGYGLSKALLANYTSYLAGAHPHLKVSCCSPGFINTGMTAGFGASKTPEEGTVAIRHLLFGSLAGNGWYYGSDGVRSPLHFMRNPGEPAYDGKVPGFDQPGGTRGSKL